VVKTIRILIGDSDPLMLETICEHLIQQGADIFVVGVARDDEETIEMAISHEPDILMLNIQNEEFDGLGCLEKLRDLTPPLPLEIIAFSGLKNLEAKLLALSLAVDVSKSINDGSLNRMEEVEQSSERVASNYRTDNVPLPSLSMTHSLDEQIAAIILALGIPAHIKGYQYLREAIKIVVEDSSRIKRITKDLYPSIALTYSTTATRVERAIRHAIEIAWNNGKITNINLMFGVTVYTGSDRPTNSELIALISDRINLERGA
jgi:two-component system response regulator (stage 0 sporulation protein A)